MRRKLERKVKCIGAAQYRNLRTPPLDFAAVQGRGGSNAVVCSLVLCSVPEQPAALAAIARVLKPGGHLVFLEHVAAGRPARAA